MAELGLTEYFGVTTPLISKADGYALPDGTQSYNLSANFSVINTEIAKSQTTQFIDRTKENIPDPGYYFVMRGKDIDCGSVTYRTWTVTGQPDTTAAFYTGPKCGANPLQDIVVVLKYKK